MVTGYKIYSVFLQIMSAFKLFGRQRRMCQTVTGARSRPKHVGLVDRQKSHTTALRRKREEFGVRQGKQNIFKDER